MLRRKKTQGNDRIVVNEWVAPLVVFHRDFDKVVQLLPWVCNVLLVAAKKAAPRPCATDELKPPRATCAFAQRLSPAHFHGSFFEIHRYQMGRNLGGMQPREEKVCHSKGFSPLAFHLAYDRIRAGIDHAVFARDIVLED